MAALLGESWAGLLALAALLLWPGLVIVRAPWPFVPFLSLSFWLVTWDWLAPSGPGRTRFLLVGLASFALLSGLRLLKPGLASRPSWPTLFVLAAGLARLAPILWWPVVPGLDAAFPSSQALLLVWRDGIPASYLPLYPILGFGLRDSGLAGLAADVSLLAGMPAHRAFLLATLASEGLLTLALFAFARRFWPEAWSAVGSVAATALLLPGAALTNETGGGVTMALAFAIGGAALVLCAHGRSACVAAGALWAGAAALSAGVLVAGGVLTLTAIIFGRGWRATGPLGLAASVAGLVLAPALWRTGQTGLPEPPGLLAATLLLLVVAGIPVAGRLRSWPEATSLAFATSSLLFVGATLADWTLRSARVAVSADELAAAAWLRDHGRATDVVCANDEAARAWIPSLSGRAASPPWWPSSVRPSPGPPLPACRFGWGPPGSHSWPEVFTQGRVSLARLPKTPARTSPDIVSQPVSEPDAPAFVR